MDLAGAYRELQGAACGQHVDVFRTERLDEAQDFVAGMFVPHGLEARATARPRPVAVGRAYMGAIGVHAMDYGREVRITPKPLEDFYLIQVPVSGGAEIEHAGRRHAIGHGEASLLPACDPIAMTWGEDCRHMVIQIDRRALEREAELLLDASLPAPVHFDVRMAWSDPGFAPLRGAASALYDTWKCARELPCRSTVEQTLSRALCQVLLVTQPSNHRERIRAPHAGRIAPRQVRRAEEFVREHLAENIAIEDIARAAGVSPRCLFDNFRAFRGITPMQYVREQRLECVRRDLLEAAPGTSVTAVALRWGFTQLGRFSAEYRARFGENPSTTLARPAGARSH